MGRIRTLKPTFFRSRSLAQCSIPARLTFQGLWCEADDHGRGIADARIIRGVVWPLDDAMTAAKVEGHLEELADTGHILLYVVERERYYEVQRWEKHQSASHRRGGPVYPLPPAETPVRSVQHDLACDDVQDRAGEGRREQGEGRREGAATQTPSPAQRGHRLPDTFRLTDAMRAIAAEKYPSVDVQAETESFIDYWRAETGAKATKLDWDAAWRVWMARQQKWSNPKQTNAIPAGRAGNRQRLRAMRSAGGSA